MEQKIIEETMVEYVGNTQMSCISLIGLVISLAMLFGSEFTWCGSLFTIVTATSTSIYYIDCTRQRRLLRKLIRNKTL